MRIGGSTARLLLVLALAGGLGACGSKDESAAPAASETPSSARATPSATPTSSGRLVEGALSREKLTFDYPSDWTFEKGAAEFEVEGHKSVSVTDTGFTVHFISEKPTSTAGKELAKGVDGPFQVLASFPLGGKTVYLLDFVSDDGRLFVPLLSGCKGPQKACPITSPTTGNLLRIEVDYLTPEHKRVPGENGPQSPDEFGADLPAWAVTLKILKSLSFT